MAEITRTNDVDPTQVQGTSYTPDSGVVYSGEQVSSTSQAQDQYAKSEQPPTAQKSGQTAPAQSSSGDFTSNALDTLSQITNDIDTSVEELYSMEWYTETIDGYWIMNDDVVEQLTQLQDYMMASEGITMLLDIWSSAMDMTLQIMFEQQSSLDGAFSKAAGKKNKKTMEYLSKGFSMANQAINDHNTGIYQTAMTNADKNTKPNILLGIIGGILINKNLSKNERMLRVSTKQAVISARKEWIDKQNFLAVQKFVDARISRTEQDANDPESDPLDAEIARTELRILQSMNGRDMTRVAGLCSGGTYLDLNKNLVTAMLTALDMLSNLRSAYFNARKKIQEAMKMILEMQMNIRIKKDYLGAIAEMIGDVSNLNRTALFVNINRLNTFITSHNASTSANYDVEKYGALLAGNIAVPILGLTDFFVLLAFPPVVTVPSSINMNQVNRQLEDWGISVSREEGVFGELDRREEDVLSRLTPNLRTLHLNSDGYLGLDYEYLNKVNAEITHIDEQRALYATAIQMIQESKTSIASIILGVELSDSSNIASQAAR